MGLGTTVEDFKRLQLRFAIVARVPEGFYSDSDVTKVNLGGVPGRQV